MGSRGCGLTRAPLHTIWVPTACHSLPTLTYVIHLVSVTCLTHGADQDLPVRLSYLTCSISSPILSVDSFT